MHKVHSPSPSIINNSHNLFQNKNHFKLFFPIKQEISSIKSLNFALKKSKFKKTHKLGANSIRDDYLHLSESHVRFHFHNFAFFSIFCFGKSELKPALSVWFACRRAFHILFHCV